MEKIPFDYCITYNTEYNTRYKRDGIHVKGVVCMKVTATPPVSWINDQLDLYNYAKSIGDAAWQADIVERLLHRDEYIEREIEEMLLQQLWKMFDQVNGRLQQLFRQLRQTFEQAKQEELREKVWQLKLERVHLTQMIRSLYPAAQQKPSQVS